HAGKELAPLAMIATPAIAAVPADAHPLARFQLADARTDGIDDSGHFVARNSGILNPRPESFLDQRIAVADAARLDFDPDRSRARLRDRPFHNLNSALTPRDLRNPHRRHDDSSFCPQEAVMPTVLPRPSFYADDWARQRVCRMEAPNYKCKLPPPLWGRVWVGESCPITPTLALPHRGGGKVLQQL